MNSLSAQMDFQKEEILDHPHWKYIDTYTDIKSGRSINSRPGFKQMMADCEEGKIDLIYTKAISRFGRNCMDFLMTLRRLKGLQVDVFFQNENLFLFSEAGKFLLTFHTGHRQNNILSSNNFLLHNKVFPLCLY
ncbi:recombinase family protein [Sphaerochaeta sp. PS]|uniref:recombinase family protein n=1 Tax=Sphaerochaeta sp. PS TaxID=3076336 RepID=UPI0028A49A3C|nr:recombinase family protein [Sphaerochaeta sp. PS]MDT4761164.1 recombinase family protein [Sphaerochaeta sp. PS]